VGVTASCAFVSIPSSAIIGTIAGIIVVFAVTFIDKLKIDDPVGAISVHLVCGVWGTLAVALFSVGPGKFSWMVGLDGKPIGPHGLFGDGNPSSLLPQIVGILAVGVTTVVLSSIFWLALKATLGIRVSSEEESSGLDIGEHGMEAYHGFLKTSEPYGSGDTADMLTSSKT
jgi:ammonium transporter, Amt family